VAAHLPRRRTAERALALRPLHNVGDADHERLGCRTAGLTRRDRRHHTLPAGPKNKLEPSQLASKPSQQVESDSRPFGNPSDSVKADRALARSPRRRLSCSSRRALDSRLPTARSVVGAIGLEVRTAGRGTPLPLRFPLPKPANRIDPRGNFLSSADRARAGPTVRDDPHSRAGVQPAGRPQARLAGWTI
jgi:hypothetical protein